MFAIGISSSGLTSLTAAGAMVRTPSVQAQFRNGADLQVLLEWGQAALTRR